MEQLVSIVIPVYNMKAFIGEAVESVLADPYGNKEIIVVDDGSHDGSGDIAEKFGGIVRVIRQVNKGASAALNAGFDAAKGNYLCWLSADDLFIPGKLEVQVGAMNSTPGAAACHTDVEVIDADGGHLEYSVGSSYLGNSSLYRLLLGNDVNGSTIMIRKNIFESMGRFDQSLKADVDGAMWFKLLAHGHGILRVSGVFGKYRWHATNQSHDHQLMSVSKDTVRRKVLENWWDKVQWWEGTPDFWTQALYDALIMDKCPESAALVALHAQSRVSGGARLQGPSITAKFRRKVSARNIRLARFKAQQMEIL